MHRAIARVVVALLAAGAAVVLPATAAVADAAECEPTYFAQGGYELFDVDQSVLPPALRGSGYDCASHIAGRPTQYGGDGTSVDYFLVYTDYSWTEFLDLLDRFESTGWLAGDEPVIIDPETAPDDTQAVTLEQARQLDPEPLFAAIRFSNLQTGRSIIALDWANGVDHSNEPAFDEPNLVAEVIITEALDATGIADPSTLSTLRTIFQVAPDPTQWAVIGGGSVVLMLLVGWPSSLLNSVIGSRYQAITMWFRSRFRRTPTSAPTAPEPAQPAGVRPKGSGLPGWLMWPGFALAAIIGAFVDPAFGLNWMSLRLVITLFCSFLLFNLAAWAVVRAVARRIQPDSEPYLRFRWGSLAIVAVAVLVARLLELQPGVIFGLVAGIAYAVTLQASRSAVITLVGSAFGLGLALVGWVGYSLLAPISGGGILPLVFLVEFLSGVTIKGIATLPLSLLPIGTLDGAKLLAWKRWVWAIAYALGLAAFMLVLLTIPKSWGEIPGDFARWTVLFGAYALLALVIWGINVWRLKMAKPKPEAQQGDQPDAITID